MNIPSQIATLLAGILLTLVSLWYGFNHHLLPEAASDEAVLIDNLFNVMMTIGTGIFILVQGSLLWVAYRYRRPSGDESDAKYIHGNIPLEIVWTAIPAMIVLALSIYSFDIYEEIGGLNPMDHGQHLAAKAVDHPASHNLLGSAIAAPLLANDAPSETSNAAIVAAAETAAQPSDPFVINVTGLQFAWIVNYPGTEISAGELHVPQGRNILLKMTALDVIHAFWVPEFRLKQDVIPGREVTLRFTPNKVGEYPLICAELCGAYHGVMKTKVVVESEADFQKWMISQQVATTSNPADAKATIAQLTYPLSDADYLAPYAQKLGITVEHIQQIQAMQQQSS